MCIRDRLSHLDLMRMLERALRRSALPISFTGGFHPLPRIQIALALPLGAEADGEWMDLEFTSPIAGEQLLKTLQALLPDGMALLSADEVPVNGKSLSQNITGAVWSFDLQLEQEAHPRWLEAVEGLMAADQLIWHDTDKKGRPRERDCRPALLQLVLVGPAEGQRVRLRLEATVDPMGRSIRPSQIQHWLEAQLGAPLHCTTCVERCCSWLSANLTSEQVAFLSRPVPVLPDPTSDIEVHRSSEGPHRTKLPRARSRGVSTPQHFRPHWPIHP